VGLTVFTGPLVSFGGGDGFARKMDSNEHIGITKLMEHTKQTSKRHESMSLSVLASHGLHCIKSGREVGAERLIEVLMDTYHSSFSYINEIDMTTSLAIQ